MERLILGLLLSCIALGAVEAQNLRPTRRDPLIVESIRRRPDVEGTEFAPTDYLQVTAQIEIVNREDYPGGQFFADILVDGKRIERVSSAGIGMRNLWNDRLNKDSFNATIGFLKVGTHTITVVVDDDDDIDESNERDNSFSQRITIKEPWIKITQPSTGVNWLADSRQRIEWEAFGLNSGIKIEYSVNGGRRWSTARTTGTSGEHLKLEASGYDQWEVAGPGSRLHGEVEYLIRARDGGDPDVKDEVAIIVDVPFLELNTDLRDQSYEAGDPIELSWDAHALEEIKVRFKAGGPLARFPVLKRLDGDVRSYVLLAPQVNCDSCRVFVETGLVGVRDWTRYFSIHSDVVDSTKFYNVPKPVAVDSTAVDTLVVDADTTLTTMPDSTVVVPADTLVTMPADSLEMPADSTVVAPADTLVSTVPDSAVVAPADTLASTVPDTTATTGIDTVAQADSLVVPVDSTVAVLPDSALADTTMPVMADTLVVPADSTAIAASDSALADIIMPVVADTLVVPADSTAIAAPDSAVVDTIATAPDTTAATAIDTVAQTDSLVVPADTTVAALPDSAMVDTTAADTLASTPPDTTTPPPSSPSGDISGDGKLGLVDALAIATYVLDPQTDLPPGFDPMAGDVNGDGELSLIDALMVATYLIDPDNPALPSSLRQKAVVLDLGLLQAGETVVVRIVPATDARAYQVQLGWNDEVVEWVGLDGLVALQEARTGRLNLFDVGAGSLLPVALHFRARNAGRATLAVDQQALGSDLLPRVVEVQPLSRPRPTSLYANTPNPFNPETTLRYALAEAGPVRLRIYDTAGRLVHELVDKYGAAGEYAVVWDGRDTAGRAVSSGVYFYRLQTRNFSQVRRMLLLK
jgi:hypothetical protein